MKNWLTHMRYNESLSGWIYCGWNNWRIASVRSLDKVTIITVWLHIIWFVCLLWLSWVGRADTILARFINNEVVCIPVSFSLSSWKLYERFCWFGSDCLTHIVRNSIWKKKNQASDNVGKFHTYLKCRIWIHHQKSII